MKTRFDFHDQHVLVTGASRGIGYAVAAAFADSGARLTLLADDAGTETAAKALLTGSGCTVDSRRCDITQREQVSAAFADMAHIDVLVNNAGLELITPMLSDEPDVEDNFCRIIEINVLGTYFVTRAALRHMGPGGRIVFTASQWGKTAVADFSGYCASKHANIGFMRSLSKELAPNHIRVNAVCPGWVRTDASMRSLRAMAVREGRTEQALLDEIVAGQAFGGLMEPEDVAQTYLFLASDAAQNITGQAIVADRGELMS